MVPLKYLNELRISFGNFFFGTCQWLNPQKRQENHSAFKKYFWRGFQDKLQENSLNAEQLLGKRRAFTLRKSTISGISGLINFNLATAQLTASLPARASFSMGPIKF